MPALLKQGLVGEQISQFLYARHGDHARALRVHVEDGLIVLRGRADSFYQRQLWLHGAMHVAGDSGVLDLIEVVGAT